MGITSAEVAFPDRAPPLSEICAKATELCSLPIVVLESHPDQLLEFHGSIAFECARDWPIEVFAYRQGSVAGFVGVIDPADTQTVHLQGFAGEDPTLMVTTRMALESFDPFLNFFPGPPPFQFVVIGDDVPLFPMGIGNGDTWSLQGFAPAPGVLALPLLQG